MRSERIRLLIADDNIEFRNIVCEFFMRHQDFSVVAVAGDGSEAIEKIETTHPEVVVLDIIMPHVDGLAVLERYQRIEDGKKPRFVVLSAVGQDKITNKAIALGADYYMLKPVELDLLANRLAELCSVEATPQAFTHQFSPKPHEVDAGPKSVEKNITEVMHVIGIPPHIKGYQYLRDAISMAVLDIDVINSVTKALYPAIADRYNTTPSRVERAIRHAIEIAWQRNTDDATHRIITQIGMKSTSKPTNSEFVAVVADKLRLELHIR